MSKSKETKVRVMDDKSTPHYSKVTKVYVKNQSDVGGTVDWNDITNKPTTFPNDEHDHDDRYNTKEDVQDIIDFTRQQMEAEQGKIMANADDELAYLENKVDNVTAVVEGNELKVKSIDGLTVGAADISAWLAGTTDNVQTQLDAINDNLVAMTSGMHYRGRLETYADLQAITNKDNGDLAVVLADESRSDGRSMYVYSESLGMWEFIGEFTFTDEFTALKDAPSSYAGADGKVVKVVGERLVFDEVEYGDLSNKPASTITQIDDAVAKRHEHINKSVLDRIGINESGQITVDGVPYVPADEPKGYLYARASSGSIATNGTWRWIKSSSRGITLRDNGVFVLEKGKTYQVTVNASISALSDWKRFELIDTETRNAPPETPNSSIVMAVNSDRNEAHSGVLSLIITPSSTRNFGITFTSGSNATTATLYGRTSLVITEI